MKILLTDRSTYQVALSNNTLVSLFVDNKYATEFRSLEEIVDATYDKSLRDIKAKGTPITSLKFEPVSFKGLIQDLKSYLNY